MEMKGSKIEMIFTCLRGFTSNIGVRNSIFRCDGNLEQFQKIIKT